MTYMAVTTGAMSSRGNVGGVPLIPLANSLMKDSQAMALESALLGEVRDYRASGHRYAPKLAFV